MFGYIYCINGLILNHLFNRNLFVMTRLILYAVLFVVSFNAGAQQRFKWPKHYTARDANAAQIIYGSIVLNNMDTLKGYFKLLSNYREVAFVAEDDRQKVKDIPLNKIRSVNVPPNAVNTNGLEFRPMEKDEIWRVVVEKGNVVIYDDAVAVPVQDYGLRMMLVSNGKKTKLYSKMTFVLHNSNVYNPVVKFIRKRYHISASKADYPTTASLLELIIDNEIKRNNKSIALR